MRQHRAEPLGLWRVPSGRILATRQRSLSYRIDWGTAPKAVPADPKIPGNLASAQTLLEMSLTHLQLQFHGIYPQARPITERAKVDDFYAARDRTTPPLPWPRIAPPFT